MRLEQDKSFPKAADKDEGKVRAGSNMSVEQSILPKLMQSGQRVNKETRALFQFPTSHHIHKLFSPNIRKAAHT